MKVRNPSLYTEQEQFLFLGKLKLLIGNFPLNQERFLRIVDRRDYKK
jgi:hypothetical protein